MFTYSYNGLYKYFIENVRHVMYYAMHAHMINYTLKIFHWLMQMSNLKKNGAITITSQKLNYKGVLKYTQFKTTYSYKIKLKNITLVLTTNHPTNALAQLFQNIYDTNLFTYNILQKILYDDDSQNTFCKTYAMVVSIQCGKCEICTKCAIRNYFFQNKVRFQLSSQNPFNMSFQKVSIYKIQQISVIKLVDQISTSNSLVEENYYIIQTIGEKLVKNGNFNKFLLFNTSNTLSVQIFQEFYIKSLKDISNQLEIQQYQTYRKYSVGAGFVKITFI
eukprot:TRINITY_DN4957_c0_g1_i4.p1 TRINITY_DN4957_c0_g1~~TRINITY_DN4957_c0_g1_i4.p1  ORF type:complete len:276 (+),score=-2.95 TRINITY_DN4957_c0_g1_i4:1143-1970(+)